MAEVTPGKDTTEHSTAQSAQKWIRLGAGIVLALVTALLSAGVVPADSAWIAVLTMLGTVAAAITGETFVAGKYIGGRSMVKAHASQAEALKANPPKPPQN